MFESVYSALSLWWPAAQSLLGELRSRKLHGAARKKKVYSSARAAITKHHKVGGLNDGNVSPHRILEARIKKIKVLAGLVPSEGGEGEPTPRVSPGF